jgi:two-component system OmpR family response regulator
MQSPLFRILCTEDDVDTRELITFVLRHNNFEVITTESPAMAIEVARAFSFDLYLIDNWMPSMSGSELCSELRSFDSETPILFYSGAGYEADKTAAYASGAQGYLVKPVDNDELVGEVRRLIADSRPNRATQTTQANVIETAQPLVQGVAA